MQQSPELLLQRKGRQVVVGSKHSPRASVVRLEWAADWETAVRTVVVRVFGWEWQQQVQNWRSVEGYYRISPDWDLAGDVR